jgi:hypothetical protein
MNGGVDVAIVCEIPHIDTAQIRTDVLPTQYRVNQTSNPPPCTQLSRPIHTPIHLVYPILYFSVLQYCHQTKKESQ